MDAAIKSLKSTTFSGRRLTRRQIAEIRDIVGFLPGTSRNRLLQAHLRAAELGVGQGRPQDRHLPVDAGEAGAPRHPDPAPEGPEQAPPHGRPPGLALRLRPAAADRGPARRPPAAAPGSGRGRRKPAAVERAGGPPPLSRPQAAVRLAHPLLRSRPRRPPACLPAVRQLDPDAALPGRMDRLERAPPGPGPRPCGVQRPVPDPALGPFAQSGLRLPRDGGPAAARGLGAPVRNPPAAGRDLRRHRAVPGLLLPSRELAARRRDRRRQGKVAEGRVRAAAGCSPGHALRPPVAGHRRPRGRGRQPP